MWPYIMDTECYVPGCFHCSQLNASPSCTHNTCMELFSPHLYIFLHHCCFLWGGGSELVCFGLRFCPIDSVWHLLFGVVRNMVSVCLNLDNMASLLKKKKFNDSLTILDKSQFEKCVRHLNTMCPPGFHLRGGPKFGKLLNSIVTQL